MRSAILGISAYYHDSAAAMLVDGEIVAAAHEERFTRKKHDSSFPVNAIRYVLDEAGVEFNKLTAISFYDKPLLKFERLLETYHAFAPRGLESFSSAIPAWIKEKLFMKRMLRDELAVFGDGKVPVYFPEHHLSHAASAFYPSPFEEAAIVTIDGVGEWATTTIGQGKGNRITILQELKFPHSVGLLYSAFTYYTGFKVNSGEYKLMGLAPYGDADSPQTVEFRQKILDPLMRVGLTAQIFLLRFELTWARPSNVKYGLELQCEYPIFLQPSLDYCALAHLCAPTFFRQKAQGSFLQLQALHLALYSCYLFFWAQVFLFQYWNDLIPSFLVGYKYLYHFA